MRDASTYRLRPRRSTDHRDGEQAAPYAKRRPQPRSSWRGEPQFTPPRVPYWGVYLLRFGAAIVVAALVPLALAKLGLAAGIASEMGAVGFDADRVQLIEFALVACMGALTAGIALRWRAPVWLGGLLYYVFGYLLPFIGHAQHPAPGPDGTPQVLLPGAFVVTIATLLAVGVLFSGMGAVLGEASGRVFIAPLVVFGRFILMRSGARGVAKVTSGSVRTALTAHGVSAVLVTAFALVTGNLDSILNYGTTTALYQSVRVAALHGTIKQEAYPSPALGGRLRAYLIYLPPSYTTLPQQRYPVLYLLHGNPGQMSNWFGGAHADTTANFLITAGKMRQTILVAPDGNGPVYPVSEWGNSFDGRQRMEDAISTHTIARWPILLTAQSAASQKAGTPPPTSPCTIPMSSGPCSA
jgi:hypothetical protein